MYDIIKRKPSQCQSRACDGREMDKNDRWYLAVNVIKGYFHDNW